MTCTGGTGAQAGQAFAGGISRVGLGSAIAVRWKMNQPACSDPGATPCMVKPKSAHFLADQAALRLRKLPRWISVLPYTDIGAIRDKDGYETLIRWDEASGIVQVRVYRFPTADEAHWDWITVGIARSWLDALTAGQVWVRG
jgi:hypothetical protein